MRHCIRCGTELAADARYCPSCGAANAIVTERPVATTAATRTVRPVTPVPPRVEPAAAAPAKAGGAPWWIVPIVIVGLIIAAWVFTSRRPEGAEDGGTRVAQQQPGPASAAPPDTGTIAPAVAQQPPAYSTIAPVAPAVTAPMVPTSTTAQVPAPQPQVAPPAAPKPAPVRTAQAKPAPRAAEQPMTSAADRPIPQKDEGRDDAEDESQISESEAVGIARSYVVSRGVYHVAPDCISVSSQGLVNVGYTVDVWDTCEGGGGSRRLGQWRVDAKTGEIFRRDDSGRYREP